MTWPRSSMVRALDSVWAPSVLQRMLHTESAGVLVFWCSGRVELTLGMVSRCSGRVELTLGMVSGCSGRVELTLGIVSGCSGRVELTLGIVSGCSGRVELTLGIVSGCSGRVELTMGTVSSYYVNPNLPATLLLRYNRITTDGLHTWLAS